MTRFVFSSFFLVALVCSLGLLVGPAQPVSAGMTFPESIFEPPPGNFSLWPDGSIPVVISKSFTKSERKMITRGLYTWGSQTKQAVRFYEISKEASSSYSRFIHILTPEEWNDLHPNEDPVEKCGSWGPQTNGPTFIWLEQPGCPRDLPSILHESGHAFNIKYDHDIIGGDYANFPLPYYRGASRHRDCQLACAADVRCKASTYAGNWALGDNPDAHCFLKNDDSIQFSSSLGLHSGKRKHEGSFAAARHVNLQGGQISGGVVPMPDRLLDGKNCKELCLEDPRCDAYTFDHGLDSYVSGSEGYIGICYKKSYRPDIPNEPHFTYEAKRGFMSGVVRIWKPKFPFPLP